MIPGENQQEKGIQPVLDPDERVIEIACGALHTLVRTDKNKILSCGYGGTYALGHGDTLTQSEFRQVVSLVNCRTSRSSTVAEEIEKIACGLSHSACIKNGRVFLWGVCGAKDNQKHILPIPIDIKSSAQMSDMKHSGLTTEQVADIQLGDNLTVILTQKVE
jgi:mitogen-activated protein kinase kinase kinase 9